MFVRHSSVLLIVAAVSLPVVMLALASHRTAPEAHACLVGPPMFPWLIEESDIVALVEVTDVGGAENSQPTVTPQATFTPTTTPTPGSPTPTIDPELPSIASPTPTSTATPFDLRGYGATGTVLKTYKGDPRSPLQIDAETRESLERAARVEEAVGKRAMCPIALGHFKYAPGTRYVLIGDGSGNQMETRMYGWWEVRADETGELYVPLPGNLFVTREIYETYLRDLEGRPDEEWYWIGADRMPFDTFERMITGAPPAQPPIVPPITGNAGLKR